MVGYKKTPTTDYLIKTTEVAPLLTQALKDNFHELTAETLWLSWRARPNLQLPTSFMCTQVKNPDEKDWTKLTHEMKYLQYMRHIP